MAKKKDKTLLFIVGGAAVAGLAWWYFSRTKAVVSPVYRVVNNPQTVAPVSAEVIQAAGAAAGTALAPGSFVAPLPEGNVTAGEGAGGKGGQPMSTGDIFPTSVYNVDVSPNMAGCGLYGDGSE